MNQKSLGGFLGGAWRFLLVILKLGRLASICLDPLGLVLGCSWGRLSAWIAVLGCLGAVLGRLGAVLGRLGAVLGGFGLSWANFWDPKSTPSKLTAILCRIQARFGPLLELVLVAFRFQNRYKNRVRFQTCQKLPPGHQKS